MNNELPLDFLAASYGLKSDDADTCDFCGNISGKDNLFAGIEASICVECAGLAKFTIDSLKGKLKTNRRMTMNKYHDKSDFEINLRVAQIIFTDSEYDVIKQSMEVVKFQNGSGKGICHVFDPCNKPVNAMPIIIENGICMSYDAFSEWCDDGSWIAQPAYGFFDEWARSDNYYRAAMICFLMMKDAENES